MNSLGGITVGDIEFCGTSFEDVEIDQYGDLIFEDEPSLCPKVDGIKVHTEEYIPDADDDEASSICLTGNVHHIGLSEGMIYKSVGGLSLRIVERIEIESDMVLLRLQEIK